MFERFDIDDKNIFKVCVIATMSSGKSTFINSIIGEEIMPEKNEACTARIMAVLDNDSSKDKRAHIIRKNGNKEIVQIDSREVLSRINNDEDVTDFVVETDIMSISNTSKALMLVDTPGVNNSEDARHGERTEGFLQQLDTGVIIYLMNATQLATNDDAILLRSVADHVEKKNGQVKVIFVINKIDALDTEAESISAIVASAKEYIEEHGIKNPTIYPMSALAAKSLRMALYRREMTRRELRRLEDIYENYQSKDNNMMAFAMTDELSGETFEIGDYTITAQELQRAIDNTGITAVEKKIENYMLELERQFSPEIVIKASVSDNVAQNYQDKLDNIMAFPSDIPMEMFETLYSELANDEVLTELNHSLGMVEEEKAAVVILADVEEANEEFDEFVNNIENTKNKFFERFSEEKLIRTKHKSGIYFAPTVEEKEKINAKFFFYVSLDGEVWSLARFGEISKYIEENKDFYLYNVYKSFCFKVKSENSADIIPLLDIKVPIKFLKIAKSNKPTVSIDEIYEHMQALSDAEEARIKEIRDAEDQLRRTYKGVVFPSEEEKYETIKLEKEVALYCQKLNDRSFEELYSYKQIVAKYPNAIFAEYTAKLIYRLEVQENKEKNAWLEKIERAGLDELEQITTRIKEQHYNEPSIFLLEKNINIRKKECQRKILDDTIKDIDVMDRVELENLRKKIKAYGFFNALVVEYEDIIQQKYDIRENQELKDLCAQMERYTISELNNLKQKIKNEDYQEKFKEPCFERITLRIEYLHMQNMESYCQNIESVDRITLNNIRQSIEEEECRPELKKKFFDRIVQRDEALDYEDLCTLTENLQDKTVGELKNLYNEVDSGKYNEKFIKEFLVRIRVALEWAQYNYLQELTCSVSQMDMEELQDIDDILEQNKYPFRVESLFRLRVSERKYILDMNELMDYRNEFNSMTLEDIDAMIRYMKENNVCQRSRNTYSKKLNIRKTNIGYENVSQFACFTKQVMDQLGISKRLDFKLALFSQDYENYLKKHFELLGRQQYEEIPVLILPECSSFAISKKAIFYKTALGYQEHKLNSVQSISTEKKFFSEYVMIVFSNGEILNLTSGINKNNANLLVSLLLAMVQNANNIAMLSQYSVYRFNIPPLGKADFELNRIPNNINMQMLKENLISSMRKSCGIQIESNAYQILFSDESFFVDGKDRVAFGEDYIYRKIANNIVPSIPYSDIWEVKWSNNILKIYTIKGDVIRSKFIAKGVNIEDENIITDCINEYIKGIQFIQNNKNNVKENQPQIKVNTVTENRCPACNTSMPSGARFCSKCGKQLVEKQTEVRAFFFCPNCGKKMPEGIKFCTNCGTRVGNH